MKCVQAIERGDRIRKMGIYSIVPSGSEKNALKTALNQSETILNVNIFQSFLQCKSSWFIPFTPKIWLVILLTVWYTILMILVLRIWCYRCRLTYDSLINIFLYSHHMPTSYCVVIERRNYVLVTGLIEHLIGWLEFVLACFCQDKVFLLISHLFVLLCVMLRKRAFNLWPLWYKLIIIIDCNKLNSYP